VDTVWDKASHTEAKHIILRRYLGAWFAIMGRFNSRILYLDGFAGPGVYTDGSPGSPLIALETLTQHSAFSPSVEYVFLFNEDRADRIEELQKNVQAMALPTNVRVHIESGKFEEVANSIIESLDEGKASLAPTFAFLDPFGPSGMPIDVVSRLLAAPKCELFCFFDLNHLIRFGTAGGASDAVMERLFGTDEFKNAPCSGKQRENYFIDLFERQLRDVGGFPHTLSFVMKGMNNKPVCAMVYATRIPLGLGKMKEAMWKVDPSGGFSFSDRTAHDAPLFGAEPDIDALAEELLDQFTTCRDVQIKTVEDFVVTGTGYCASHTRRALRLLEDSGQVSVRMSSGGKRRRHTYPKGRTLLTFA
jgi:three-Cys-motif partner protein